MTAFLAGVPGRLKALADDVTTLLSRVTGAVASQTSVDTLTTRLSSDRAGYLDNLDSTMLSNGSVVKLVQHGSVTGDNETTATISSVTPSKAFIHVAAGDASSGPGVSDWRLTNSTTITMNISGGPRTIYYQVVEYY
jgi:hypothetical protein